jgi:hypothetical protein
MVFVHLGISLDGFVAAVSRGAQRVRPHGDEGPEWMFPAGVKAAATGW